MAVDIEDIRIGLSIGVDNPGIARALNELSKVRREIDTLTNEFKTGAKDVDTYTKELATLEKQARKLDEALASAGENRRIGTDGALVDPAQASAGAALRRLGREGRNLPSMQIPGAGIGTDAISNIVRLTGAFTDLTAKSKVAAIAANVLTPALGAQAAATAAAYAPIAILVGGIVAIGVAITAFTNETSKNADRINAFAENQRDLNKRIADGLTTEDAQAELDRLTEAQQRNRETLATLQGAYDESQRRAGILGGVTKVLSGDEEALANQIEETNKTIKDQQAEMDALSAALANGSLAANDAADAEAKLAAERSAALLTEAQQAGELAQLRDRAANMNAEQIKTELEAVERRRVGVEAELAVLQASGDTSEEVAKKIAALTGQLGFLGEQANVLKNTTPKANTAEIEKAAKEAEKAANDAARAQQTYSDKVRDAGKRYRDAVADINTATRDKLDDNQRKYEDDILKGAIEFNDEQLKEQREYERDLASIKRDAARAELDATRSRDFAALRDAREDRAAALDERRQEELDANSEQQIEYQQHLAELARDRQLANRDALIDQQRSYRDAKIDRSRALRDARQDLADYHRDRNAQEQTFMRASLTNWQSYFSQLARMQAQAGGSTATRSSGSGLTPSFDQLQYALGGG